MPKGIPNKIDDIKIQRIRDYIDRHFIVTGDPEDRILSYHIHEDIFDFHKKYLWEYKGIHLTSKILLSNEGIKRKVIGGNQYHTGIRYKENQNEIDMMFDKQLDRSSIGE